MTYPVKWNRYKIFRDFIQNFYDSVPNANWKESFFYKYENGILQLSMPNIVFNYEWLLHIGASTKTEAHNSAGYFGEGFKIASLCAVRDCHWTVKMSSGEWAL